MPTDRSLPAFRRSASQAGRRRFDPGRPLSLRAVSRQGFLARSIRRPPRTRQRARPRKGRAARQAHPALRETEMLPEAEAFVIEQQHGMAVMGWYYRL